MPAFFVRLACFAEMDPCGIVARRLHLSIERVKKKPVVLLQQAL
jgi:hypothetical protein